jgi:hypothetical protein
MSSRNERRWSKAGANKAFSYHRFSDLSVNGQAHRHSVREPSGSKGLQLPPIAADAGQGRRALCGRKSLVRLLRNRSKAAATLMAGLGRKQTLATSNPNQDLVTPVLTG